jgi:hypothetical protein
MADTTRPRRNATVWSRHHAPRTAREHGKRHIGTGTHTSAGAAPDARRWPMWAACMAALGFALPHVWWLFGVSWAFPGDFSEISSQSKAQALGDWVIVMFAIVFALLPFALVTPRGRVLHRRMLYVLAWFASVVLVLWSLGYFYMQIMLAAGRVVSAPKYAAQDGSPSAVWGFYWYGLFLVWGIALGATAWWSRRTE